MTLSIMHASPIAKLASPVAIVCHDAGGANIILSWLQMGGAENCRLYLGGPAARLNASHGAFPVSGSLEEALEGCRTLVSGTGWASELEHRARVMAREKSIHSIAVLDHWVNYAERFQGPDRTVMPDEIWVTDPYALERAQALFPGTRLRQFENSYLAGQVRRIAALPATGDMLYVLEPARSTWGGKLEGEFQALDFLVTTLPRLELPPAVPIRLRPHPSDPPGKYDDWIRAHPNLDVRLDLSRDMGEAIGPARWVAGCESFGLVLALEAGRTVFCTLPPWAPACRLPHSGLLHLKSLELQA